MRRGDIKAVTPCPAGACPHCAQAQVDRLHGGYQAACQGCSVRALAKGLGFAQSMREGALTRDYRRALFALFRGDVPAGHEAVKREHGRLKETP